MKTKENFLKVLSLVAGLLGVFFIWVGVYQVTTNAQQSCDGLTSFGEQQCIQMSQGMCTWTNNICVEAQQWGWGGGWGPNRAQIYTSIGETLASWGIANNLTWVTTGNVNSFSGLYFAKLSGSNELGRFSFATGLDLTDTWTQNFLQYDLSTSITINQWSIKFNPGTGFIGKAATLTMNMPAAYSWYLSGLDKNDFVVKDGSGNVVISGNDLITNVTTAACVGTWNFACPISLNVGHFTQYDLKPFLTSVHISAIPNGTGAGSGDIIILSFTGSDALTGVSVTIAGQPAGVSGGGPTRFASGIVTTGINGLPVPFTIDFKNYVNNSGNQVTGTTNASYVNYTTQWGWGGGPIRATVYTNIGNVLAASGILNNFSEVTNENVTVFSGLYFAKLSGSDELGKLTFPRELDLTDTGVNEMLQSLWELEKMDMEPWYIKFAPGLNNALNNWAQLTMNFDTGDIFVTAVNDPSYFLVKDASGNVVNSDDVVSNALWACGVGEPYCTIIFDAAHFTEFTLRPLLTSIHIESSNTNPWIANPGDTIYLAFQSNNPITGVVVNIAGHNINPIGGGTSWTGMYVMTGDDTLWNVQFSIDYMDYQGISGVNVTWTNDWSLVDFNIYDTSKIKNTTQLIWYDTIQAAIDAASNGDTITVESGTYVWDINITMGGLVFEWLDTPIISGQVTFGTSPIMMNWFTIDDIYIPNNNYPDSIRDAAMIISSGGTIFVDGNYSYSEVPEITIDRPMSIIGTGNGNNQTSLMFNSTRWKMTINSPDVIIKNFYFSVQASDYTMIQANAVTGVRFENCSFEQGIVNNATEWILSVTGNYRQWQMWSYPGAQPSNYSGNVDFTPRCSDSICSSLIYIDYGYIYNNIWIALWEPWMIWSSLSDQMGNFPNPVTNENVTGYVWLYFEKQGMFPQPVGRIEFPQALDLSDTGTQDFIKTITWTEVFDTTEWYVKFNPGNSILNTSGKVNMYFPSSNDGCMFSNNVTSPDNFIVKNTSGDVIDGSGIITNIQPSYDPSHACWISFEVSQFGSFDLKPVFNLMTPNSDYSNPSFAKPGSTITLNFTANEDLSWVQVHIAGNLADLTGGPRDWTATYTMTSWDTEGMIPYSVLYYDLNGLSGYISANSDITFTKTIAGSFYFQYAVNGYVDTSSPDTTLSVDEPADYMFTGDVVWWVVTGSTVDNRTNISLPLTPGDGVKNISFQVMTGGMESVVYTASIILDTTSPTAPVILTPINGSYTTNTNPEITWSASIDTGIGLDLYAYYLSISTDSGFSSNVYTYYLAETWLSSASWFEAWGALATWTYYVKVGAREAIGNPIIPVDSEIISFTIADFVTPTATLSYDYETLTNHDVTVTITWANWIIILSGGAYTHLFTGNDSFTFYFEDLEGNIGSSTAMVDWIDKNAPVITIDAYNTGRTNQNILVTASTNEWTLNTTGHLFTGNGLFNFIATDVAGNQTTQTITISKINKVAPIVTFSGQNPKNMLLNTAYIEAWATWSDDVDGTGSNVTISGSVITGTMGTYILTYLYIDTAGNIWQTIRTVNVLDNTPFINLNGSSTVTIEYGNNYVESGATWADAIDGTWTVSTINGSVNTWVLWTYTRTYIYVNNGGFTWSTTRIVNVVDTTAPIVTLLGSWTVTIEYGNSYIESWAKWTDTHDGSGTNVTISGNVNTWILWTYILNYSKTDSNSNVSNTVTRIVNVVDTTAPVVTLNWSWTVNVEFGNSYTEIGATWTDIYDGTGTATISGSINTWILWTYTLSYRYIDNSWNTWNTVTRTVNVVDTTAPVITLIGSLSVNVEYGNAYTELWATWTDAHDGTWNATISGSVNTWVLWTYIISYKKADAAGNTGTTVTRTVIVQDTILPTANVIYSNTWLTNQNVTATLTGYSEQLTGLISSTHQFTWNGIFTFTFSDLQGNTGSATAIVNNIDKSTVSGSIAYNPSSLTNQDVIATITFNKTGVTVNNNSNLTGYIFTNTWTFTFNFTDVAGNTGSTTAIVTWIDKTAPTVIKLWNWTSDYTLNAGSTGGLLFSEAISNTGQIQSALTFWADHAPTYTWSGNTLIIIANASGTTWTNDVAVNVTDLAGNTSNTQLLIDSVIDTWTQVNGSGAVSLTTGQTQVVISTNAVAISIPDTVTNATIIVPVSTSGTTTVATVPAITMNVDSTSFTNNIMVSIPANTTITAPSTWTGIIIVPTVKENSSVTPPTEAGKTNTVESVIEVWFAAGRLTFDKAVSILIPGQSGKKAGYTVAGGAFTEIINTCNINNSWVILATDSECKINSWTDLVIWTKHFTTFATYTQTTNTSNTSNWDGWSSLTKDFCATRDCSISYYDGICGVCSSTTTGTTHAAASIKMGSIAGSKFSTELNNAYLYAYNIGITTASQIQLANMEGNLIRSHMAKMLVNYAVKVLWKQPDATKICNFSDLINQTAEMRSYAKLACQLWLMGVDPQGNAIRYFKPNGIVTRAEFGTVLSRSLYGTTYNNITPFYSKHLAALKNAGIMTNISNPLSTKEKRGRVMLMLMRAKK